MTRLPIRRCTRVLRPLDPVNVEVSDAPAPRRRWCRRGEGLSTQYRRAGLRHVRRSPAAPPVSSTPAVPGTPAVFSASVVAALGTSARCFFPSSDRLHRWGKGRVRGALQRAASTLPAIRRASATASPLASGKRSVPARRRRSDICHRRTMTIGSGLQPRRTRLYGTLCGWGRVRTWVSWKNRTC